MDLRSVLPGIPLLALTASVQINERTKLIKACGMLQPLIYCGRFTQQGKHHVQFHLCSKRKGSSYSLEVDCNNGFRTGEKQPTYNCFL